MAGLILGTHPETLTVRLVDGDGATLIATQTDSAGDPTDWAAAPTLRFAARGYDLELLAVPATVDGEHATWTLTTEQVSSLRADVLNARSDGATSARITVPDDADGTVTHAGNVEWSNGWQGGSSTQRVTYTLAGPQGPAGPPGSGGGGGSDTLILVSGGTVTLDDTKPEGTIVGYRVKATATFEGEGGACDLEPGAYTFERTDTGWTYYAAVGTALTDNTTPPSDWSTLATDTFTAPDGTPVLGRTTTTGGLMWVDQQNGANILIQSNAAAFSGGGYGTALNLPLGASYSNGVRISFDYAFTAPGGSVAVGANITWTPHVSGIEFGGGNIGTSGAVPPTGLTGTLTGNPNSGRLEVEYVAANIVVRINGTQVATATNGGELLGSSFRVAWNSATCVLDNVLVEVHA